MMRQNKNLMDINIDALYNILKQNQRDVNDAMGSKKKNVVVTSDPLALIAEKTNVSRSKEKSANKKQEFFKSDDKKVKKKADEKKRDMSKVKCYNCKKEGHFAKYYKKAKAFNRRKFYSRPTNNNLRTSSTSQSANKKQEFFKSDDKKVK
nr:hypothetical protein [Tanacetum cinerariifolium]